MARAARIVTIRSIGMLVVGAVLLAAAGVSQAATPEEAASGAVDGIFIEDGAEPVDTQRVAAAIEDAAAAGFDLTVVVLADTPDAVAYARSLDDIVGGTVLVFTPTEYGAASQELSQSDLDEALDEADSRLAGDDAGAGVSAFVSAITPSRAMWPFILGAAILVVAAVALVGRRYELRATAGRRRAALERRWDELRQRVDALSNPVLDLSTSVDLDGRDELARQYRNAASEYGEVRDSVDKTATASAVANLERRITELEQRIAAIAEALDSGEAG